MGTGRRASFPRLARFALGAVSPLLVLLLTTAGVAVGCSLLVTDDALQCHTNADCVRFPGTVCVQGGCARSAPVVDAAPDVSESACTTTQDCLVQTNGRFSICRPRDKTCVSLLSRDCGAVLGAYKSDDAIFIGALVPSFGTHLSTGLSLQSALKLAATDFVLGLPPRPGSPDRRPLAIIVCDEAEDAARAARHLVSDVGVPAILGASFNDATLQVASSVTNAAGVLLLSPTSAGDLGAVSSAGLVRRTCPPAAEEARAMSLVVSDILEPRIVTAPGVKMRVAVVNKTDSGSAALESALVATLAFNGGIPARDAANAGYFIQADYGNPDQNPNASYTVAIAAVTDLAALPDVVVVIGNTEGATHVVKGIESSWPASRRPYYVLSGGVAVPELLSKVVSTNDELRKRILGTAPGADPNSNALREFVVRYQQGIVDGISDVHVFGTANAYDAVYLLAFAIGSLGEKPITGASVAGALGLMSVPGAPSFEVGPSALALPDGGADDSVFSAVGRAGIDLAGVSGPLDFDAKGEVSSDVQIWCVVRDDAARPPAFAPSGKFYSHATGKLAGTLVPSCSN